MADPTAPAWTGPRLAIAAGLAGAVLAIGVAVGWWRSQPPPLHGDRIRTTTMPDDLEPTPPLRRMDEGPSTRRAEPPFDFTGLTVERDLIESGGVGRDAIPALTGPTVVAADEADEQIDDAERVIGVHLDGVRRAYPVKVLMSHEIVNDTLGSTPIAVVYCPLCDSATVVDRRRDGRTLEFGVSGLLMNSNVLMYDRATEGLWSQLEFEAISGPDAGSTLPHLPWTLTSWSAWRAAHPETTVLSTRTGYRRDYDRQPYGDYFESDDLMFPVAVEDDRLPRKTRVVGVVVDDAAHAFTYDGTDAIRVEINGVRLHLEPREDGVAVIAAPPGARIAHAYWFAWFAAHPETTLTVR